VGSTTLPDQVVGSRRRSRRRRRQRSSTNRRASLRPARRARRSRGGCWPRGCSPGHACVHHRSSAPSS
jgi:hypothetical protein